MIQAMYNNRSEITDRAPFQNSAPGADFTRIFGEAAAAPRHALSSRASFPGTNSSDTPSTPTPDLGEPDVQTWLNNYYQEHGNPNAAQVSYEPAAGAGNNFPTGTVYGPDAIFAQAFANQAGNAFGQMTGIGGAQFTSQLPGIPSEAVQQEFDQKLVTENLQRLQAGEPIDTTAYWSDPGSITDNGVTYTSQQLGYAGPGQSSGPQPIYISQANQIAPDTYSVPGYQGSVKGIEPGKYYTLSQLEKAGLPVGQPDAQFYPGSWSTTAT